ncbi:MAG TPA: DUF2080 family transposase-associated protein [Candidatus Nanoarchaeia archaeon]|nr:DUF2080 family transposase-associated protein [Candidatus Nanoarchaeia archaeon]
MSDKVAQILADVSLKLETINRDLERVMPRVDVREVSSFGNSGHIVLSKKLVDKKVGVIVLDDADIQKNERRQKK